MIIIGLVVLLMVMIILIIALTAVFSTRNCNDDGCDGLPMWSPWNGCSVTCGSGIQQRVRLCTRTEKQNGSFCPHGWLKDTQDCTMIPCPASVCYGPYITLSEDYRREHVSHDYNCDKNKVDGTSWYRFALVTGENGVIGHCPAKNTCGTYGPIWMNGSHPTEYGVIKDVMMRASFDDNCFYLSGAASVTKCIVNGELFYLYKLWKPNACYRSYCTATYDLEG